MTVAFPQPVATSRRQLSRLVAVAGRAPQYGDTGFNLQDLPEVPRTIRGHGSGTRRLDFG
jgi:hypothetical protein